MTDLRYKLVLSDFDGTLLADNDIITPATVDAIKRFTAAGGVFGISSGRSFKSLGARLGELGLRGQFPVLCCQGAVAFNSESGEVINRIPMKTDEAYSFLRLAEELNLACQFYTDSEVYAPCLDERNKPYFDRCRILPIEVGCVSEYLLGFDMPVIKVLALIDPRDRVKMLKKFGGLKGMRVFASSPWLLEAVSLNAGKGNGLLGVCRSLKIDPAQSVAIGDELNDIDMIKAAGLGVAMGNAVDETKACARYITSDNNHDGVAEVLDKIISGEL